MPMKSNKRAYTISLPPYDFSKETVFPHAFSEIPVKQMSVRNSLEERCRGKPG